MRVVLSCTFLTQNPRIDSAPMDTHFKKHVSIVIVLPLFFDQVSKFQDESMRVCLPCMFKVWNAQLLFGTTSRDDCGMMRISSCQ